MTATTITMPQTVFVDRLKRAIKFVSPRAAGLPALEAVQIRVIGSNVTFTATDRYVLGVFRWTPPVQYGDDRKPIPAEPFADQFAVNVPTAAAVQITKMFPYTRQHQGATVTLTVEGCELTVTNTDGLRLATPQNEQEFPRTDSIWAGLKDGQTVQSVGRFDPALVAKAMTAMAEPKGSVTYWQSTDRGAMAFRSENGVALVMPMRGDSGVDTVPGLVDGWSEALGV